MFFRALTVTVLLVVCFWGLCSFIKGIMGVLLCSDRLCGVFCPPAPWSSWGALRRHLVFSQNVRVVAWLSISDQ
uniref:Uncharacterized protein n=1 Tax=Physcomitrium patens TaxID=3218 RepID=A0A2K1IN89_PHYPA|nr:hypothetical protein PHYPA_027050 [Physcomitrium patens]